MDIASRLSHNPNRRSEFRASIKFQSPDKRFDLPHILPPHFDFVAPTIASRSSRMYRNPRVCRFTDTSLLLIYLAKLTLCPEPHLALSISHDASLPPRPLPCVLSGD
jgi:hypothetical protein